MTDLITKLFVKDKRGWGVCWLEAINEGRWGPLANLDFFSHHPKVVWLDFREKMDLESWFIKITTLTAGSPISTF